MKRMIWDKNLEPHRNADFQVLMVWVRVQESAQ